MVVGSQGSALCIALRKERQCWLQKVSIKYVDSSMQFLEGVLLCLLLMVVNQ